MKEVSKMNFELIIVEYMSLSKMSGGGGGGACEMSWLGWEALRWVG